VRGPFYRLWGGGSDLHPASPGRLGGRERSLLSLALERRGGCLEMQRGNWRNSDFLIVDLGKFWTILAWLASICVIALPLSPFLPMIAKEITSQSYICF